MAGQTMRLLPRTDYDAGGLGVGGNATVVVARKLDTSRWREGVVLARLHAATWPTGAAVKVIVAPDGYTDEDPAAIWAVSTSTLITFTQGTDTPPAVKNASLTAPFGPLMQIQLQFALVPGGATGTFKPSVSIDLNLKGE